MHITDALPRQDPDVEGIENDKNLLRAVLGRSTVARLEAVRMVEGDQEDDDSESDGRVTDWAEREHLAMDKYWKSLNGMKTKAGRLLVVRKLQKDFIIDELFDDEAWYESMGMEL